MVIQESIVTLKDGKAAVLRSPEPSDAAQLNEYLRLTSGETHFMVRYPEECNQSIEAAQRRLRAMYDDFMPCTSSDWTIDCSGNRMSSGL